jgi:DNA-binding NtrC family response regulator
MILVIDDNPAVAEALAMLFSLHDVDTVTAASPEEGLALLEHAAVDLVVQDMNFRADTTSGEEGIALFHALRARYPDLPVILLTAWTHLESALDLVRAGAADYLAKPWDDRKLMATVNTLLELADTRRRLTAREHGERQRQVRLAREFDLRGVVFADAATEAALRLACQVARSDLPVLVTGPNGVGKEKFAEVIHANSTVKLGPFVAVNCGALPHELVEAELFGAEAGAYTGASKPREGTFEAADGGTLFLDEIGTLPLAGQVKLLRVLETGRFQRLGSTRERQVKVRVLSATNADLGAMIAGGQFREDLFWRLAGVEVRIPALNERPDDILPLARHLLPMGKRLGASAEQALCAHAWPGNVRELRHCLQRAALLARGDIVEAADLGLADAGPRGGTAPGTAVRAAGDRGSDHDEPGRAEIEAALARNGGVLAQAASELGLSRQALYRRLDRLGIKREG